jgi:hypothetical protein
MEWEEIINLASPGLLIIYAVRWGASAPGLVASPILAVDAKPSRSSTLVLDTGRHL